MRPSSDDYTRGGIIPGPHPYATRTTTEPPTGARVEISMSHGRPEIRLYDDQGDDVTPYPPNEAEDEQ